MSKSEDRVVYVPAPYRRDQSPLIASWPSADNSRPKVYFTNLDARLRPVEPSVGPQIYFMTKGEDLKVTPYNFPELHALFEQFKRHASSEPYSLYIAEYYPNKAYIDRTKQTITISLDQLNMNSFESIQFLMGHELGHLWHDKHAHKHSSLPHHQAFTAEKFLEVEADMFARCLSGNTQAIMRGIRMMGINQEGDTHPSTQRRLAAVIATSPYDCIPFGLNSLIVSGKPRARNQK
jgi:hypothetical protein